MTPRLLLRAALALVAIPLALDAQAARQTPPTPQAPKSFRVPPARHVTLANGMKVSFVPYGTIPKALVRLVVQTGNVDEATSEVWLADLMADLMSEGTTTRTAAQVAEAAASMGGALRLAVATNQTSIGGEVLAEYGPEMVRLVAEVARTPRFPASELARLTENRLRQLALARSQQQSLAVERFLGLLYPDHPYGRVFPTEAMLRSYTVEQARAFYARNFGAARARLYVVGQFDAAAVERAVREAFGDWAAGQAAAPPPPQPKTGRVVHLVDRPGAVQSTIYVGLPVVAPSHPDFLALRVTNALLGGSFASRITTNIREQKGYTYSPSSQLDTQLFGTSYWVEVADVTTNVTGPALREILAEVERLRREPPSAQELRGIQNYLAGNFVLQNSSRGGIAGQLMFLALHGLEEDYLRDYVERVHAVTPADVQRMARTYLRGAEMTIVVAGDRAQVAEQLAPFGTVVP